MRAVPERDQELGALLSFFVQQLRIETAQNDGIIKKKGPHHIEASR